MSWKHILNPWGYNIDLERQLAETSYSLSRAEKTIERVVAENHNLAADLRMQKAINTANEQTNLRLHRLIAEGHFRNPATGRLGPKGETYQ